MRRRIRTLCVHGSSQYFTIHHVPCAQSYTCMCVPCASSTTRHAQHAKLYMYVRALRASSTTRHAQCTVGLGWAGLGLKTENNVQTSSYVARHYRSRARGVALGCDLRTCVGAWGQLYWVYTLSKGTCTSPADSCTCECSWLQRAAAVDPIRGASVSTAASACCRSR